MSAPANTIEIALAQVPPGGSLNSALDEARGVDVVVFPEMLSTGYVGPDRSTAAGVEEWRARAEPIHGGYISSVCQAARDYELAISIGFLERDGSEVFNSAVVVDRLGQIVLHQRKRFTCFFSSVEEHLSRGTSSEVAHLTLGSGRTVSLGILICMDREFAEPIADLVDGGVELVVVPNSCELVEDRDVGDVRLAGIRSLGFQNVVAVAVANYPAPINDGNSVLVDGRGTVVEQAGTEVEVRRGTIDLGELRRQQSEDSFRRSYPSTDASTAD